MMNGTATDPLLNHKVALSLLVAGHSLVILLPSVILNTAILLTFLFSKHFHNPLLVLYGTMVAAAIVNGITRFLTTPVHVPKMVLGCSCQAYLMEVLFSATVHHFFYPLTLAAMATVQLFIPMYRFKGAITYVSITTVLAIVLVLAVPLAFFLIALTDTLGICTVICQGAPFPTGEYGGLLAALAPVQALSLVVTVACYLWSMRHYETMAIRNSGISRRVASFPVLMSAWTAIQALFHLAPFALAGEGASAIGLYWSMLILNIPFFFSDVSGLVLPALLLILSRKTRSNLLLLVRKCYGNFSLFFYFEVLPVVRRVYRRYTAQVSPAQQFPPATSPETETTTSQLTVS